MIFPSSSFSAIPEITSRGRPSCRLRRLIVGLAVPLAAFFAALWPAAAQAAPGAPDLLWYSVNPIDLSVGVPFEVTLTVSNGGLGASPSTLVPANGGQIAVNFPAGVALDGPVPTGCSATASGLSCSVTGLSTPTAGNLAPGQTKDITFQIVASAPVTGNLTGTISGVTGTAGTVETITDNNSLTVPVTATGYPDLVPTINGQNLLTVGVPEIYTVMVANVGNGVNSDGTVTITLPLDVTIDPLSLPSYCLVDSTTNTVTCSPLPAIHPGTFPLDIPLKLTANAPITSESIVVTITGVTGELNVANNTISEELNAVPAPQPDLTSTVEGPDTLTVGEPELYTVTVTNIGTAASTDGSLTITLPADTTGTIDPALLPAGVTCSGMSCTLGMIDLGKVVTIPLEVTATKAFSNEKITTAITAVSGETIEDNNSGELFPIGALEPPPVPTAGDLGQVTPVPALDEVALALLALLIGGLGYFAQRKMRR